MCRSLDCERRPETQRHTANIKVHTGLDFNPGFNDKRLLQRTYWDLLHHKELLGLAVLKANES